MISIVNARSLFVGTLIFASLAFLAKGYPLLAFGVSLTSSDGCSATFFALYNASSKMADNGRYPEAAALREASANLFEDCLSENRAPRTGIYPFDGVGAYLIAATFWHLAGEKAEAKRALSLGKSALREVLIRYPASMLHDQQRLYLYQMNRLIHDDDAGKWAIWTE
jgi:hypothetical protein